MRWPFSKYSTLGCARSVQPSDNGQSFLLVRWLCNIGFRWRRLETIVYMGNIARQPGRLHDVLASGLEVPAMHFHQQVIARSGAALIANEVTATIAVVEPESIFAA